jgi:hypothetical protein
MPAMSRRFLIGRDPYLTSDLLPIEKSGMGEIKNLGRILM